MSIKLFTTPTCPNCKIISSKMDAAGIDYEKIIATENIDAVKEYGIKQAPSLVVDDETRNIYSGINQIKEFLAEYVK